MTAFYNMPNYLDTVASLYSFKGRTTPGQPKPSPSLGYAPFGYAAPFGAANTYTAPQSSDALYSEIFNMINVLINAILGDLLNSDSSPAPQTPAIPDFSDRPTPLPRTNSPSDSPLPSSLPRSLTLAPERKTILPTSKTTVFSNSWGDPHFNTFHKESFDYHGLKGETEELLMNVDTPNFQYASVMEQWGGGDATVNGTGFMRILAQSDESNEEGQKVQEHQVVIDEDAGTVMVDGQALVLDDPNAGVKTFTLASIDTADGDNVQGKLEFKTNPETKEKELHYTMGKIAGIINIKTGGTSPYTEHKEYLTDLDKTYAMNGIIGDQTDKGYVKVDGDGYFIDRNGDGQKQDGEHVKFDSYVAARTNAADTSNESYFNAMKAFSQTDKSAFDKPPEWTTLSVSGNDTATSTK